MKLTTTYLGLKLKNPLIVGASPFCDNLTICRELEAAGASAIVMHSLFEEQLDAESRAFVANTEGAAESFSEAASFFPRYEEYHLGPIQYIRRLTRLRKLVEIPIIASLNGRNLGTWVSYAQQMEDAGASAIELNMYQLVTSPVVAGDQVEADMLRIVRSVVSSVKIPVAVKLSPYHTALAQFARTLENAGVAGLVLFNRFYQPDFNIDDLEVVPQLKLSDPSELLPRLRWLSILSPHFEGSLSCSGGVHRAEDVIKAILAGAHSVQLVSVLLKQGPAYVATLLEGLYAWMVEHDYASVDEFRGAMNLSRCPDAAAHERANYIRILQSWKV
ncbi:MAG TPA: dihydroorotate dehydrogenase-like protein [Opitutaceae bacterium]